MENSGLKCQHHAKSHCDGHRQVAQTGVHSSQVGVGDGVADVGGRPDENCVVDLKIGLEWICIRLDWITR